MKKLIVILLVLFCVGLQAQTRKWDFKPIWINVGELEIPTGIDTTTLFNNWEYYPITDKDEIKEITDNNKWLLEDIKINDSLIYYTNLKEYREGIWDGSCFQIQVRVTEGKRVTIYPTEKEKNDKKIRNEIREMIKDGKDKYYRKYFIDSVYYGKRTKIKLDTIN